MPLISRLILAVCLLPFAVLAQDVYVPEELRDWQEWVLHGKEHRQCPFFFDRNPAARADFVCAWPGTLDLVVAADSGRFTQQWTVYADEQWLPLPGDANYWPHRVTVNGRGAEVVARNDIPSVYLGPGSYSISGSFAWDERPGVLRLPERIGVVALTVNGQEIVRPERTRLGLFLGERQRQTQARDAVEAEVYRLVSDNVPTRLTTRLRINVAGGVREELFGPVLPGGFSPLRLQSQLPARLEPGGNLRIQVRPGTWIVELDARAPGMLNAVSMPTPANNLPNEEIWSYASNDIQRVTAAEGLPPVDPAQADVPPDWRDLPAYRVTAGATLTIAERSRGMVAADNELTLRRRMWLDFDGGGFVVADEIGVPA